MSRYTGPKNRLSRREGEDLFGKGNKLRRSQVTPGQHGPKKSRRLSDYGLRLREKQKIRRIYGIIERQFRGYFEKARKVRGKTGEVLLRLLETRLDNVIYRLGLVPTRAMARQLVSHGHVKVNGKKVTVPSYQIKVGDTVDLKPDIQHVPHIESRVNNTEILPPAWLKRNSFSGLVVSLPLRSQIDTPVEEQLIVEYYSR